MSKKLQIKITSEGKTGRIDIIGSISEWNRNNATDFRYRCTELKEGGVSSCHVYLMTTGGDCFQANEIVNILNEIFGSYTAEGGAVVASAGTYIAVRASSFVLAKNGQFMVHKPSTFIDGNETEVENNLKLLKNITKDYYDTYVSRLKKPETEFKAKWDAGDFWMTAREALEWGFVSEIKEPVAIDDETAGVIRACGSPFAVSINSNNNHLKMKNLVTLLIAAFALDNITSDSSEAEVVAALQGKIKPLNDEIAQLKADAKAGQDAAIKALLDEAQSQGKIVAAGGKKVEEIRAAYEKIAQTGGIEVLQTVLAGLQKPVSILSQIQGGKSTPTAEHNWNWYQEHDSASLAKMEKENPDAFNALYKAEYGIEPVNS
jgi:ATP-dependent protease ClpP protease subunit